MSGIDNLRIRLSYRGGPRQQSRMQEDKLRTLKKALLYSYQARTAILKDGKEFRCLMNPDKLDPDYDKKVLSIPFEDICLNGERLGKTSDGIEPIDLKGGDVFQCKEDGTYWLIYLNILDETAYYRAKIIKCDVEVEINGIQYRIYFRGPLATEINWRQKSDNDWNELNYQPLIYITKDENTEAFFHRFQKIKIEGKPYVVNIANTHEGDGIIKVYLEEDFSNTIKDEGYIEPENQDTIGEPIEGLTLVQPYDVVTYKSNVGGGSWRIDNNKKAKIINQNNLEVEIEIITSKSGNFNLQYIVDNEVHDELPIVITSL